MKTLIFILSAVFTISLFAQGVPNGNFENWTQGTGYSDPTGWDTPNSTSSSIGVVTVSKESTIVQNGSFAAKLQTKSILGTPIPGLITLGDFNINIITFEATITGGTPFTGRPESLSGYYQYEPVFNDEAFIGVILLKQNGAIWDTVADGAFTSTSNLTSWTPFVAPITYRTTDIPTHLNIIIMSSDRNAPQPNSTLYVDNLTFTYSADIQEQQNEFINVFQDNNLIQVVSQDQYIKIQTVGIFSIDGKYVAGNIHDKALNSSELPVNGLSTGYYMVRIGLSNGISLNRKIFIE